MRIRFFRNDRLTREILVKNLKINPVFAKTVFDIAHLKSLYPFNESSNNSRRMNLDKTLEIDKIQKTIHDFQRLYQWQSSVLSYKLLFSISKFKECELQASMFHKKKQNWNTLNLQDI